jgi:HD superfamily phosphodiesterase
MYTENRDAEHEELLELAGRAELAARSHDHETLLATTHRFLTALAMHLDNEREDQRLLDAAARDHRARSVQKVVEEFVNLVHAASVRSDANCRCERLARQAVVLLRHQIEVEALA